MKLIIATVLLALGCGRAAAFHPLISEDTGFLGKDVRQIEATLAHTVSREGADVYATDAAAELSYGLFEKVDVLVTVPWHGWGSHGISESGLGDVLVETKFPVRGFAGWDLALKPGFSLPAGDEAKSLGAGEGGVWLYGIAGRTEGDWQYYLNAGYLYNRNSLEERTNILKGSAAAAYSFLPKWMVSADLAMETNAEKDSVSHPVSAVFGLVWSPYPTLDLDIGASFALPARRTTWVCWPA